MNFVKYTAAVLAVLAALSIVGCESGKTSSIVSEPVTEPTRLSPQSIVFGWQTVYEQKLSEFAASDKYNSGAFGSMFDLRDINGDGSPELIISPDTNANSVCEIYTVSDGKLLLIGEYGSYGTFGYLPEKNMLSFRYVSESVEIGEYSIISDDGIDVKLKYFNNSGAVATGAKLTYEINEEKVTISEYEDALAEYSGQPSLTLGRKYSFSSDSVDYALHYTESWGAVLTDKQKELYRSKLRELMQAAEKEAAFELCDLDGDDVPELVYSEGIFNLSECRVFVLDGDSVSEPECNVGVNGRVSFDIEKNVLTSPDISGQKAWSLSDGITEDYIQSESIMDCGRKYLLSEDSLKAAFR